MWSSPMIPIFPKRPPATCLIQLQAASREEKRSSPPKVNRILTLVSESDQASIPVPICPWRPSAMSAPLDEDTVPTDTLTCWRRDSIWSGKGCGPRSQTGHEITELRWKRVWNPISQIWEVRPVAGRKGSSWLARDARSPVSWGWAGSHCSFCTCRKSVAYRNEF